MFDIAPQWSRATGGRVDDVTTRFLSDANRARLHNTIVRSVHSGTNGKIKIGPQSDPALQMLMIDTLNGGNATGQSVEFLNDIVVDRATSNILGNVASYLHYAGRELGDNAVRTYSDALSRPATSRTTSREIEGRAPY